MRCWAVFFTTLILQVPIGHAQDSRKVPKAKLYVSPCEELCADLIAAIQLQPATLEMRLEDALVMQESCAAELVSAAKYAVRDDPAQMNLILNTALKLAPQRASAVRAALLRSQPVVSELMPQEEVRRAELPAGLSLMKKDKAQIARELRQGGPPLEIRRAQLPDAAPKIEVRRAELPTGPRLKMTTRKRR